MQSGSRAALVAIGEQCTTHGPNRGVSLTVYLMKRQSAPPMTRGILTSARMRSHCVAFLLPERTKACDSRHWACAHRLMLYATCHQMPWLLAMDLLGNSQTLALMTGRIFTHGVWHTPVGNARQKTMSVLCTHAGVSAPEDRICRASDASQCRHRQQGSQAPHTRCCSVPCEIHKGSFHAPPVPEVDPAHHTKIFNA